jgi:alpha-aminoadipic semialdehyde synthase
MNTRAGIRREDKNVWERRAPITPEHVSELARQHGLQFCVQPSAIRAIPESAYRAAGATIQEDLAECPIVFAVKEIPTDLFRPRGVYVFFAHVIKGQPYNMPMLKRMLELGCTLIDYEKVTDDQGRRLVFFGRFAGMAGMVDTLWALGQRHLLEGIASPFSQIQMTFRYGESGPVRQAVRHVGEQISRQGLPPSLVPFVCGFAGYGNVSRGAQEIFDELPVRDISPAQLLTLHQEPADAHVVYKVVFKEIDTVQPRDPIRIFDLAHFMSHPDQYQSQFKQYLPHLSVLVNAVYWTRQSPRLVTKADLKELYAGASLPKLQVIGDISCDIEGAIEATLHSTEPDDPVFVYDPQTEKAIPGVAGHGPVIMAVDNLPCELPIESSTDFSTALKPFLPDIVTADFSVPWEELQLPPEIKRAVIAYAGQLTPSYRYIQQYL